MRFCGTRKIAFICIALLISSLLAVISFWNFCMEPNFSIRLVVPNDWSYRTNFNIQWLIDWSYRPLQHTMVDWLIIPNKLQHRMVDWLIIPTTSAYSGWLIDHTEQTSAYNGWLIDHTDHFSIQWLIDWSYRPLHLRRRRSGSCCCVVCQSWLEAGHSWCSFT